MSLINEALKKAQRARTTRMADTAAAPVPGGGTVAKRGPARSANTIVMLGAGAAALVVVSVGVTIFLVSRPSGRQPTPVAQPKLVATPVGGEAGPVIVKPVLPAPPVAAPPAALITPAPVPSVSTPPPPATVAAVPVTPEQAPAAAAAQPALRPAAPAPQPVSAEASKQVAKTTSIAAPPPPAQPKPASNPGQAGATEASAAPAVAAASAPPVAPAVPARQDDRIAAYIEALRIAGVRAAGADSRVLINERVYRINDIIDRTLGIRLIKVAQGSLTFTDQNGATYEKYL